MSEKSNRYCKPVAMTPNQPVIVAPSANGYWIIPIPGPMAIPDGSLQRWDKRSLFEYLDDHFPDKVWATAEDGGGHA